MASFWARCTRSADAQGSPVDAGVSSRAATDDAAAGVVERARERARELLRTHQVEPLPDDVSRRLDEIMARARRELVKN